MLKLEDYDEEAQATEVIDPFFVEVIRSCIAPISSIEDRTIPRLHGMQF